MITDETNAAESAPLGEYSTPRRTYVTVAESESNGSTEKPGLTTKGTANPNDSRDQPGLLAVLNDLHKGRDANSSWKWLIDVIGVLLVVISMTGLLLQLFLRKRRRSALASAAIGAILSLVFAYLTLR